VLVTKSNAKKNKNKKLLELLFLSFFNLIVVLSNVYMYIFYCKAIN